MYYIGTEQECIAYDQEVTAGEKYPSKVFNWANPKKKHDEDLWAILAHEDYPSNLDTVETLEGWVAEEVV